MVAAVGLGERRHTGRVGSHGHAAVVFTVVTLRIADNGVFMPIRPFGVSAQ